MVKPFLFGLTIGGIGTLLAMQYHLVRTDERFLLVSRSHQPPIRSAYVDIRNWNEAAWKNYPELQEAVIKAGREDLLTSKKKAELAAEKSPVAGQIASQLREVATTGLTPIMTATELRQNSAGTTNTTNRSTTSPTAPAEPAGSDWANSPISYKAHQGQHNFPTMQKTVPNPLEMDSPRNVPQAQAPAAQSGSEAKRPSWVLNLIRNMNPLESSASDSPKQSQQIPQPVSSGPAPQEVAPVEVKPLPNGGTPPREDSAFPASPRRIPVATWQLN